MPVFRLPPLVLFAALLSCAVGAGLPVFPVAAAEPAPAASKEATERHIVNEDEQVRIDELRVRGETQRITVQPKVASAPAYEIVTHDVGSKAQSGQRVWHILGF